MTVPGDRNAPGLQSLRGDPLTSEPAFPHMLPGSPPGVPSEHTMHTPHFKGEVAWHGFSVRRRLSRRDAASDRGRISQAWGTVPVPTPLPTLMGPPLCRPRRIKPLPGNCLHRRQHRGLPPKESRRTQAHRSTSMRKGRGRQTGHVSDGSEDGDLGTVGGLRPRPPRPQRCSAFC